MVALLAFSDGEPFATGAIQYSYEPATSWETTPRIILKVAFENRPVTAVVDTGAPYVICAPQVARYIAPDLSISLGKERLHLRGVWMEGHLHRLSLRFEAERGEHLEIEATAFVPDLQSEDVWRDLPSFIGLGGCLERIRFAVDPGDDTFYFGPLH